MNTITIPVDVAQRLLDIIGNPHGEIDPIDGNAIECVEAAVTAARCGAKVVAQS